MASETCIHGGCDRPRGLRRGYCNRHYRLWHNGDDMDMPVPAPTVGCLVDGCERPHKCRGYCNTHYARVCRHGDAATVSKPGWKSGTRWVATVGYREMHKRLDRTYGTASEYACVDCGQQACDWAYTNDDPGELLASTGCRYSVLPEYYQPRCRPCHRAFDRRSRAAA